MDRFRSLPVMWIGAVCCAVVLATFGSTALTGGAGSAYGGLDPCLNSAPTWEDCGGTGCNFQFEACAGSSGNQICDPEGGGLGFCGDIDCTNTMDCSGNFDCKPT